MSTQKIYKFIDIGANLTDSMYKGIYNGSTKHQSDLKQVLERSFKAGLEKMILTGGSLSESKTALELAQDDVAVGSFRIIKECLEDNLENRNKIKVVEFLITLPCANTNCKRNI